MAESMNPDSLSDSSSVDLNMSTMDTGMKTPELAEGGAGPTDKMGLQQDEGATAGAQGPVEGGIDRLLQEHRK